MTSEQRETIEENFAFIAESLKNIDGRLGKMESDKEAIRMPQNIELTPEQHNEIIQCLTICRGVVPVNTEIHDRLSKLLT